MYGIGYYAERSYYFQKITPIFIVLWENFEISGGLITDNNEWHL